MKLKRVQPLIIISDTELRGFVDMISCAIRTLVSITRDVNVGIKKMNIYYQDYACCVREVIAKYV